MCVRVSEDGAGEGEILKREGRGGGVETDLRKRRLKTRGRMGREKVHTREREKL